MNEYHDSIADEDIFTMKTTFPSGQIIHLSIYLSISP